MKLKKGFICQQAGGVNVLVCKDSKLFSGLVKLNDTAKFIVSQLKSDTTKEKILNEMKSVYSGDEELMKKDIDKITATLEQINALDY